MLDAFKIKPFDLEPVLEQWKDGPRFKGNAKKDPPVEQWLEEIKAGCVERGVPEECWHRVAQHFMGPKAKSRFDEVKAVVSRVNGGSYRWTWKKFKLAMLNMGWTIDTAATETIKVQGKGLSLWFSRKKEEKKVDVPTGSSGTLPRPTPTRASTFFGARRNSVDDATTTTTPRRPQRSNTDFFWPLKSKDDLDESSTRPTLSKIKSDSLVPISAKSADEGKEVSVETKAPVWLLNACTAIDFLTNEHPKAMSIISAILITAGSLPALPAISAGVGGTVLASGAVQAIGAIAVGLGQALGATVAKNNNQNAQVQASSTVR
ncbi:hypothetical protein JOM56_012641 [Amanita muscaria]